MRNKVRVLHQPLGNSPSRPSLQTPFGQTHFPIGKHHTPVKCPGYKRMKKPIPVVDLFSGPGGLAEGFAQLQTKSGRSRYNIELSIENEEVAHRTLRLRAFLRKFQIFPDEYYEYVNGSISYEPDWAKLYPQEWKESGEDTPRVELGTAEARSLLRDRIGKIYEEHGTRRALRTLPRNSAATWGSPSASLSRKSVLWDSGIFDMTARRAAGDEVWPRASLPASAAACTKSPSMRKNSAKA